MNELASIRLDKWLWAARFFKTRAVAASAIKTGKVLVDGHRAKPARTISPGVSLSIRRGPYEYHVEVTALSHQRLSASKAIDLYTESRASIEAREILATQLKAEAAAQPRPPRRPSKRERRQIIRFTKKSAE